MGVTVELFGIPRQRAGVASADVDGASLGDVLARLTSRFPRLADDCIDGRQLRAGYTANLGGDKFVTDPDTPLAPGDLLLLMSLDAGG